MDASADFVDLADPFEEFEDLPAAAQRRLRLAANGVPGGAHSQPVGVAWRATEDDDRIDNARRAGSSEALLFAPPCSPLGVLALAERVLRVLAEVLDEGAELVTP